MSGFRYGDKIVTISGVQHRLRFSVSALAEIADVFQAESPRALAGRLRKADLADWNKILRCVMRPPRSGDVGPEELRYILPVLSALMTEGFRS